MTTSQVADAGTALMGFLGGFCAVIFLLIFFYVVFEFVNLLRGRDGQDLRQKDVGNQAGAKRGDQKARGAG